MTKQVVKYFLVVAIAATWSSTFAQKDIDVVTDRPRIVEDGGTGLYAAQMTIEGSLLSHTVFRPQNLEVFHKEKRLPIIVWGNGACANSPWEHINFLSEIASHGFLVVAIGPMLDQNKEDIGKSTSSQLIDGLNWAIAENSNPESPYYDKIDTAKIAVSGMSCGGLQALEVASDPRMKTVVICNSGIFSTPGNGRSAMPSLTKDHLQKIHSPTLYLLGGESDIAYENGMDDYRRINHVPVFMANLDVGHAGTYSHPHGGKFATVATAWFKWQLKGDKSASELFVGDQPGLLRDTLWRAEKKNIP